MIEASYGGFSSEVTGALATAAWGWHIETAIHVLRLIVGGVFDRFPKLQVVIGQLSGWTYPATFLNLLLEIGADRIMFSADYPFLPMVASRAFLERLPVSPADKERIAHGNAERLLRM